MRTNHLSTAVSLYAADALPQYAADALSAALPDKPWYERHSQRRLLSDTVYRHCKRLLDVGVCLVLLPLVLPLLGLCGLAIKLESRGPFLFVQQRTGKNARRFRLYKLRTMIADAEEQKARYLSLNKLTYPDFKIENDPRITRVGRFLRKTSLDELPQLFNVLRGDMSLVGPRPTSFSASTYALWHTARLEAEPGITGLWQISGRNELDYSSFTNWRSKRWPGSAILVRC